MSSPAESCLERVCYDLTFPTRFFWGKNLNPSLHSTSSWAGCSRVYSLNMNPDMRYGHGGQWTVKRNFPFLLSLTSGNQTTVSAVAAPTCSATCTSALALVTGKPYKYAWSDLLGDSKLGAEVNSVFIHSYMKGLGDPRGLFQPKYFSGSKTVWHSSVLPRVSNRGGH